MTLYLRVEIDPGTSETEAAHDLADLAERIRTTVEASHNGVVMRARPFQLASDVLAAFKREQLSA